ncbi:hypothetical protein ACGIF2_06470 [Cellulomonas sp. P22]|uniref:hypothetical protein n=1 Tax=Cellulomonas sp. P22 TaxID=3373189 RepID=UPI0037AA1323
MAVLVGVLLSIVGWLRLPAVARDTLWAEDGRVFLWDAFYAPAWSTLLRPYDGYLHLLPRFAAELTVLTAAPPSYATAVSAAACLLAGGAGALVYVCARSVTDNPWLRIAFAAVTLLVPALPLEVLGNLANVHWFALWLTPWLLLYLPETRVGAWLFGLVALACALTEIQTAFFVPLVLWRWRDRRGWVIRAGLLVGLVAQVLGAPDRAPRTSPVPAAEDVISGYLVNAVLSLWWGSEEAITLTVIRFGWGAAALVLVPSCAALILVLRRGTPTQRLAAITFPAASVVLWSAALLISRPEAGWSRPDASSTRVLTLLRYAVVPSMLLLAALILALTVLPRHPGAYAAAAVVMTPLLVAAVTNFSPALTSRSNGPEWAPEVREALEECREDPTVTAPALAVAPPGWTSRVPCELLEEGG